MFQGNDIHKSYIFLRMFSNDAIAVYKTFQCYIISRTEYTSA